MIPYDSRIDIKFDVKVVKNSRFDYFHLVYIKNSKFSYKTRLENGRIICFDTFRIYSIYPEQVVGGGGI